ncbi:MAG: vitamin K epoxide reductase family protein [Gammaproteobacteria bacterium]|nr:vitamin K epoxide reductase family protein [Gammaproteobacteria bacterium]
MSRKNKPRKKAPGAPPAAPARVTRDLPLALVAGVGVVLTAVLLWGASRAAGLPYCGAGSGCDVVQGSAWSRFLGVPLALWGLLLYVAIVLVALGVRRVARRQAWSLFLATAGVGVSLYLTAVSLFAIGATCTYCLISLGLMTLIFVLAWRGRAVGAASRPAGAGVAAAAVLSLAMQANAGGLFGATGAADPALVALAEHLAARGALFYGASWCPHCQQQKELFGAAASHLPYVECSPNGPRAARATSCEMADIKNYPTWIIDGRRIERVMTPAVLARLSAFEGEVGAEATAD